MKQQCHKWIVNRPVHQNIVRCWTVQVQQQQAYVYIQMTSHENKTTQLTILFVFRSGRASCLEKSADKGHQSDFPVPRDAVRHGADEQCRLQFHNASKACKLQVKHNYVIASVSLLTG